MTRSKMPGLKTYGRVNHNKTKRNQRISNVEDTKMTWSDLVNKSDSFDKLAKTCNVYKEDVKMTECHAGKTGENGGTVKKHRRGLSLKKHRLKENSSLNRQSICPKKSPTATFPLHSIYSCKPYPLISPIYKPADSKVMLQMSHKGIKTSFDDVSNVDEREKKVTAIMKNLGIEESSDKSKSLPTDEHILVAESMEHLILSNFEHDVSFRPTSTPTGQSRPTALALTFPSTHIDRYCDKLVCTSSGTKKLQSTDPSLYTRNYLTELQPNVHHERSKTPNCHAFHETYLASHDNSECLEAGTKAMIIKMASVKIQPITFSCKMILPSPSKEYENNPDSYMSSTQSAMFRNEVQIMINESEATTVPIESSLSLTPACLKSNERLSCSLLQQSLMSLCHQPTILDFDTCFPKSHIKKCSKVGEGTYGEVFAVTINTELLILKVVPIEGDFEINGATQAKFEDIENEAVVSRELSDLRIGERCSTFIRLIKTYCIKGEYPKSLLRAWRKYHKEIGSENENPKVFDADQLYMIFVYENGGTDLEKYKFSSASQVISTFRQLCCALAVAEDTFHFEHRDLHWGNVLVSKTDTQIVKFKLSENKSITVRSEGISVRIIDYSICRLQKGTGKTIYTDLSSDDSLFTGQGDYQFEVYRMMKVHNKNNWKEFNPKTNVYWLGYILEKLCGKVKCSRSKRDERKLVIKQLMDFQKLLPSYDSSLQFIMEWETAEIDVSDDADVSVN